MSDRQPDAIHVNQVPVVPVTDGISRQDFATTDALTGWLLRFAPGSRWPEVDVHEAEERYYVLEGEIVEGERRFGQGTYVVFAPGTKHQPWTESGALILGVNVRRQS